MLILLARAGQQPMKTLILDNRRITIKEVANDVGLSFGSSQAIFTHVLCMKRTATKIVPKLLNFEQKQRRSHRHRSRDVDDV